MKLALVHDHLIQRGGAEQVLKVLTGMWPTAPVFTLLHDPKAMVDMFASTRVVTSFLQHWPGALRRYQWFLPLMPLATESHDLMDYDIVVSSSSAMAKGVITRSNGVHICYCHTPTRYLWSDTHRYVEELRYPGFVKKLIPYVLSRLRIWDQLAAQRVDVYVANSKNVADRIKKYYRRDSIIIHPPVATQQFTISSKVGNYFLTGGRLVAYKRFDIVVAAFNRLGIPLKIFGTGPEAAKLRAMAKPNIEFFDYVDQASLCKLYQEAIAFINPQVEDFGITMVESLASGRPVIAYAAGGSREIVVEGMTGTFFGEQAWEALADAVVRFKPEHYQSAVIKKYAEQFSIAEFERQFQQLIISEWEHVNRKTINCGLTRGA